MSAFVKHHECFNLQCFNQLSEFTDVKKNQMLFVGKLLSQYRCQFCSLRSVGGVAVSCLLLPCIHTDAQGGSTEMKERQSREDVDQSWR